MLMLFINIHLESNVTSTQKKSWIVVFKPINSNWQCCFKMSPITFWSYVVKIFQVKLFQPTSSLLFPQTEIPWKWRTEHQIHGMPHTLPKTEKPLVKKSFQSLQPQKIWMKCHDMVSSCCFWSWYLNRGALLWLEVKPGTFLASNAWKIHFNSNY